MKVFGSKKSQKNLAIIGGIFFLLPFFFGGGLSMLIILFSNLDKMTPEIWDKVVYNVLASLFWIVLGGGLVIYGLVGRKAD